MIFDALYPHERHVSLWGFVLPMLAVAHLAHHQAKRVYGKRLKAGLDDKCSWCLARCD